MLKSVKSSYFFSFWCKILKYKTINLKNRPVNSEFTTVCTDRNFSYNLLLFYSHTHRHTWYREQVFNTMNVISWKMIAYLHEETYKL